MELLEGLQEKDRAGPRKYQVNDQPPQAAALSEQLQPTDQRRQPWH